MGDVANLRRIQSEFVKVLQDRKSAVWLRRSIEPELVNCFLHGEQIVFEHIYADWDQTLALPTPLPTPDGITARARNLTFLWLPGTTDWEVVLDLLARAQIDSENRYPQLVEACYESLLASL